MFKEQFSSDILQLESTFEEVHTVYTLLLAKFSKNGNVQEIMKSSQKNKAIYAFLEFA